MQSPARSPGAIVLGGNYRALAVVRSLGRHGVPVWAAPTDGHALAAASRYARGLPWQGLAGEDLVTALLGLAEHGAQDWVLIATDDEDAELLARSHARLSEAFRLTSPSWDQLRLAADKRETYALAARHGIAHPRIWPSGRRGPPDLPAGAFPVVVKPAFRPRAIAASTPKAWLAADAARLAMIWGEACRIVAEDTLIVQEAVPGDGRRQLAYAAVCRDGEVLASIAARRLRQRPMDFGQASTFVETIDEARVAAPAQRWLAAARATGLVEVEFKQADGQPPKLLDVNPRAWGWVSLGARAGVDFPWLLWRMAVGLPIGAAHARAGVRWMRPVTDAPTAAAEILGGRLRLRDYAASWRPPLDLATLAADDPMPGLLEPAALARLGLQRAIAARRAA